MQLNYWDANKGVVILLQYKGVVILQLAMYNVIMKCLLCNEQISRGIAHYGLHLRCYRKVFNESKYLEFKSLNRLTIESEKSDSYMNSFFIGKFRKYEAKLNNVKYILKFQESSWPELVPVEYFCNKLGDALGVFVAKGYAVIEFQGEHVYIVRNFMQDLAAPNNLEHIYHHVKEGQKNFNVENIANSIMRETGSIIEVEKFLYGILYDSLIGNHDRHGRNLGIIKSGAKTKLAPIYDNVSVLGIEEGPLLEADWDPKGKIYTADSEEPGIKNYVKELRRLEFENIVRKFYNKLSRIDLDQILESAPLLSDRMRNALKRLINKRRSEFYEEYNCERIQSKQN